MENVQKTFDYLLKDFKPNLEYKDTWIKLENGSKMLERYSVELPKNLTIWYPFIVHMMFTKIKNFPDLGRFEKILWEIPILYKDYPFVIAHRKFGFSICATEKKENFENYALEAISNIHKAIPSTEKLMGSIVHERLRDGKVTIESKYTKMRNRYLFFREKITEENSTEEIKLRDLNNFKITDFKDGDAFADHHKTIRRYSSAKEYYLLAMIDSYFSLLEHISILLIPFIKEIKIQEISIENFITCNWKTKLRTVLQYKTNKDATKYLEILDEIKEQIRNPASHGDYYKNGSSFYVHMEGVGAIPFTLTKSKLNFKFSDISKSIMSFDNIIKHFDDFDNYLNSSNTSFGMMYIKRDLPVAFDKKSVSTCRKRIRTEKSTQKYIEDTIKEIENAMNMDW